MDIVTFRSREEFEKKHGPRPEQPKCSANTPMSRSGVHSINLTFNINKSGVNAVKQGLEELEKLCGPVVEYLKKHNPYTSVVITADFIKVEETQVSIPINNK